MNAAPEVVVVDCGLGNLDSLKRALEECGARVEIANAPERVARAERIVLPGVGAFPDAMRNLRSRGLDEAVVSAVVAGIPILGVCLGMQLLARSSEEFEGAEGLGLIAAEVRRLVPVAATERVPHIGWNEVHPLHDSPLLQGLEDGQDFYFVHSYHAVCEKESDVLATTPYCGGFASVIGRNRVFGAQFHPEKSQKAGFRLLRNFLAFA